MESSATTVHHSDYICTRCHSSFHDTPSHSSGTDEKIAPKVKIPKLFPCQYCIGLLDHAHQETIIDKIIQKLSQENYEGLNSFQLCVSLPQSLVLHQGVIAFNVTTPNNSVFDFVKDNFKYEIMKALSQRLSLRIITNSPFKISLNFKHEDIDVMYKTMANKRNKNKKFTYTHELVQKTLQSLTTEEIQGFNSKLLDVHCTLNIITTHEPLFLAGRYNKFSRTLSQSPWIIGGVKKAETSVQEILTFHTQKAFRCDDIVFSSSGREDVDVKMLGTGRPFMLEIINPRQLTFDRCNELEAGINKSTNDISVRNLKLVDRKTGQILKMGEEEKEKHYSSLIWSKCELNTDSIQFLNDVTDLHIHQKTPIRVLHRRSLATRERVIYNLKATLIDAHHFQLDLSTQAGTYIKEFVHGDFGRTQPNLCTLMKLNVDIVALNVTEIKLEWPP